jgi:hypothetical protein
VPYRALLGEAVKVRVHDAERREITGAGRREELLDAADMGHVTGHPERVEGRRELKVPFEGVAGGKVQARPR